ncbi:hypothetical protein [Lacicoccus qingdaonensis]|nr:hypothetical protein [Salinicoccus qingdaonensis]
MARGAVLKCSSTTRGDSSCPLDPFKSMALLSRVIPEYPSRKTDKKKDYKTYYTRGSAQKVKHNETEQIKIYSPIIDYYLYLKDIEEEESYERIAAGKVLLEMADMSLYR